MMEKKVIDQKEYLKKYLSSGDGDDNKKEKKKKMKSKGKTVKIIEDDLNLKNIRSMEDNEFDIFINGEDAPLIVGVVDERGPVDFSDKRRWKIMAAAGGGDLTVTSREIKQPKKVQNDSADNLSPPRKEICSNDDLSPPRISKKQKKKSRKNEDNDLSPPRKIKNYDSFDLSPLCKNKKHKSNNRNESDSDLSPPRKSRKESDSDLSPRRKNKKNSNSDFSAPMKHKHRDERSERSRSHKHSEKNSRPDRRRNDSDMNPPRRMHRDVDTSSSSFREDSRDRCKSHKTNYSYDDDSKRLSREDSYDRKSKQKDNDEKDSDKRMKKTLDGKKAGLQGARELREEIEAHKRRETEYFKMLSKEVTGAGQAAVVRDTKTGRKRNLEAEAAEERERQKRQAELDKKYAKWGKGLKQLQDREEKLKDDLYEMSKPLARYADDADLNKRLREQDREGDPMLEYIKQKQIKEGKRKPDRPTYEGSFMPNRFGIKPGCRWDGVDRSNGYEKKWFDAQNAKVALQEEAYKWSTSDM